MVQDHVFEMRWKLIRLTDKNVIRSSTYHMGSTRPCVPQYAALALKLQNLLIWNFIRPLICYIHQS